MEKLQSTSAKWKDLERVREMSKKEESEQSQEAHSNFSPEEGQMIVEKRRKGSVVPKRQANQTRPTAEMSFEDITIRTPGNDWQYEKRTHKKRGDDNTLVGKKADFSITPFLNKSKGFADNSPDSQRSRSLSLSIPEDQVIANSPVVFGGRDDNSVGESPSVQMEPSNGVRRKVTKPKKKALVEASDSEVNRSILRVSKAAFKAGPKKRVRLGAATEVEPANQDQENSTATNTTKERYTPAARIAAETRSPTSKPPDADTKTKKRKLLGATANPNLEDDCIESTQNLEMPLRSGPAKRVKAPLGGGITNAFASTGKAFSPLKRHRRGVNASFLG